MALEPSGEVEFEQNDMDLPRGDPGRADQLVDIDGARSERSDDHFTFALADVGQGLWRFVFVGGGELDRRGGRAAQDRRQRLDDVSGTG